MSISFPITESGSTLERLRLQREGGARVTSPARVEANPRNCQRSTGPRTIDSKRRASRNAMKHGLCCTLSCLPSECAATFGMFVAELEAELHPATALQRIVFNQIASLTWRMERLPEAQTKLFNQELAKVASDGPDGPDDDGDGDADDKIEVARAFSPSDVLAHRFSDSPGNNGFALLERYERGMRSQLLRLIRQFDQLKKQRATTPYDPNEEFEMRRAKYEQQLRDDEERYQATREANARRDAEEAAKAKPDWAALRDEHARRDALEHPSEGAGGTEPGKAPTLAAQSDSAGPRGAGVEGDERLDPASEVAAACAVATARPAAGALDRPEVEDPLARTSKRSQSKPAKNVDSKQRTGKETVAERAPATKRSQCDRTLLRHAAPEPARRGRASPGAHLQVSCEKMGSS